MLTVYLIGCLISFIIVVSTFVKDYNQGCTIVLSELIGSLLALTAISWLAVFIALMYKASDIEFRKDK